MISVKSIIDTIYTLIGNNKDLKIVRKHMVGKKTTGEIDCQYMDFEKVNNYFKSILFQTILHFYINIFVRDKKINKNKKITIVDKFIIELEAQLEDKGVSLSIDNQAREYLANKGYDEVYGARELSRIIQLEVKKPMAEELIFGKLVKGGHVEINLKNNNICFNFSNKQESKKELV